MKNIAIFGSNGAIGHAFVEQLSCTYPDAKVHAISRHTESVKVKKNIIFHQVNYEDENSIEAFVKQISEKQALDLSIVAIGSLHHDTIRPEKALRDLNTQKFEHVFHVNTFLPAIIAKYVLPSMNKERKSIFAALSARVGSIGDNELGGWYAYRASKAALNMILKNAAIEMSRINSHNIVVGLHPGTVNSNLSKPFQKNVDNNRLFSPEYSVSQLLKVINGLTPNDSGQCFAWNGKAITP